MDEREFADGVFVRKDQAVAEIDRLQAENTKLKEAVQDASEMIAKINQDRVDAKAARDAVLAAMTGAHGFLELGLTERAFNVTRAALGAWNDEGTRIVSGGVKSAADASSPHDRHVSAVATLTAMGWTHAGGVRWRPPIGPQSAQPVPVATVTRDRSEIDRLVQKLRRGIPVTGVMSNAADWLETLAEAEFDLVCRINSAKLPAPTVWQPMDTAPTDFTQVLVAVQRGPFVYVVQGAHAFGRWINAADIDAEPLCWMPKERIPDRFLPWKAAQTALAQERR